MSPSSDFESTRMFRMEQAKPQKKEETARSKAPGTHLLRFDQATDAKVE